MHAAPAVVLPFWLDRPPREALEIAERADSLGFHELWIGEMLHFDAFALAGAVAGTTRLTLTVGPLAAGVRDPASLARGVASVAVLGQRPVRLALGASTPAVVRGWHGRDWGGEPERMEIVAGEVRSLLAGERTTSGYRSALGPQPVHLSIAALGPRMLEVAARAADRVVLNLVTADQVRRIHGRLRGILGDAGRSGSTPAVWLVAALEPTAATRGQVTSQLALYLKAPGYRDMLRESGFGELVDDALGGRPLRELASAVSDEMLEAVTAWGSRRTVLDRIAAYREAGADPAIVPATGDDPGARRVLEAVAAG